MLAPVPPRRLSRRAALALLLCGAGAVSLLALVVWFTRGTAVPAAQLLRDPLAVLEAPFYIGLVSNVGALLWGGSCALCAFCATAAGRAPGGRVEARFFAAAALLSGWLLGDDALMLHEQVLPHYLGLPGTLSFLVSGVAAGAFLVAFRRFILCGDWPLLLAALLLLAASFAVDQLHDYHLLGRFGLPAVGDAQLLLEDGLKLCGIAAWMAYFWCCGLNLFDRRGPGEDQP